MGGGGLALPTRKIRASEGAGEEGVDVRALMEHTVHRQEERLWGGFLL